MWAVTYIGISSTLDAFANRNHIYVPVTLQSQQISSVLLTLITASKWRYLPDVLLHLVTWYVTISSSCKILWLFYSAGFVCYAFYFRHLKTLWGITRLPQTALQHKTAREPLVGRDLKLTPRHCNIRVWAQAWDNSATLPACGLGLAFRWIYSQICLQFVEN